ncbi:MAG: hypothetical protein GXO22_09035 [Aquificae bacterium]|nr:hypothetical protein [Aquificota bacterium]
MNQKIKKTYVFNQSTAQLLEKLKISLGKSETQIISDALICLERYTNREKEFKDNLEIFISKIENLSFLLGKYEEKIKQLEEKLKK